MGKLLDRILVAKIFARCVASFVLLILMLPRGNLLEFVRTPTAFFLVFD